MPARNAISWQAGLRLAHLRPEHSTTVGETEKASDLLADVDRCVNWLGKEKQRSRRRLRRAYFIKSGLKITNSIGKFSGGGLGYD